MSVAVALRPIEGPSAWRGDQIFRDHDWIYHLCAKELDELERVGARFLDDDPDLRVVGAEEYPLPVGAAALKAWGAKPKSRRNSPNFI